MSERSDRPSGPRHGMGAAPGGDAEVIPGSLASLETTLPPTPLKKLLAADGASVYALTVDPTLIEVVHEAAGEQYPIYTVAEWSDLLDHAGSGRCRIALLDADLVGSGLERRVGELHAAAEGMVVVVAAPRDVAQNLIGLLSDRSVHRLLIKPAAVGITRLLLESAVSRFLQLREALQLAREEPLIAPKRQVTPPSQSWMTPWMIAVVLVSLLLGALIAGSFVRFATDDAAEAPPLAGTRAPPAPVASETVVGETVVGTAAEASVPGTRPASPATASTAAGSPADERAAPAASQAGSAETENGRGAPAAGTVAPAAAETAAAGAAASTAPAETAAGAAAASTAPAETSGRGSAPADQAAIASLLAEASAAVEAGRLAEPAGTSALDRYASILALRPGHAEAAAGRAAVLEQLFGRVETALLGGDVASAESTLAQIRRHVPGSSRLAFLEAQLAAAVDDAPAPAGAAAAAAADAVPAAAAVPDELASLLALARARIARDQLVSPAGDSARDYLERAAAIDPANPALLAIRATLATEIAGQARLRLDSGEVDIAAELIDEAFALGADSDVLVQLDLDLEAALAARAARQQAAMLARARALIDEGRLVAPPDDNAFDALSALESGAGVALPGLAAAWDRLSSAMAAEAEAAIAAQDFAAADGWLERLRAAGRDPATVDALAADLAAARLQQTFLETPARTGELEILVAQPVEYPSLAQDRSIEGWVEVQFVVDREGLPTRLEVFGAEPAGWFEEAALEAVSGYRFTPYERDGRVFERLARVRIRFDLQ